MFASAWQILTAIFFISALTKLVYKLIKEANDGLGHKQHQNQRQHLQHLAQHHRGQFIRSIAALSGWQPAAEQVVATQLELPSERRQQQQQQQQQQLGSDEEFAAGQIATEEEHRLRLERLEQRQRFRRRVRALLLSGRQAAELLPSTIGHHNRQHHEADHHRHQQQEQQQQQQIVGELVTAQNVAKQQQQQQEQEKHDELSARAGSSVGSEQRTDYSCKNGKANTFGAQTNTATQRAVRQHISSARQQTHFQRPNNEQTAAATNHERHVEDRYNEASSLDQDDSTKTSTKTRIAWFFAIILIETFLLEPFKFLTQALTNSLRIFCNFLDAIEGIEPSLATTPEPSLGDDESPPSQTEIKVNQLSHGLASPIAAAAVAELFTANTAINQQTEPSPARLEEATSVASDERRQKQSHRPQQQQRPAASYNRRRQGRSNYFHRRYLSRRSLSAALLEDDSC